MYKIQSFILAILGIISFLRYFLLNKYLRKSKNLEEQSIYEFIKSASSKKYFQIFPISIDSEFKTLCYSVNILTLLTYVLIFIFILSIMFHN